MHITKVNNLNLTNYNAPAFKSIVSDGEENANQYRPDYANKMVTVPVSLLMALATMASTPAKSAQNINETENIEMTTQSIQQAEQTEFYKGHMKDKNILLKKDFKFEGKNYTMYFYTFDRINEGVDRRVHSVRIIPWDLKMNTIPEEGIFSIQELIIHEVDNNTWLEARARSNYIERFRSYFDKSFRLPDDVAQVLVDMVAGVSKFKNKTTISHSYSNENTISSVKYIRAK